MSFDPSDPMSAMSDYARLFDDAYGRLRREDPAALFAAMDNAAAKVASKGAAASKPILPRRPYKCLGDFKRDLLGRNVLIGKRWGVRGTVVMIVSSTGTGKSVVQTQMAASFALGIPCCGLVPARPFRSWVIQSEDDEDRVAIDRDDIFGEWAEQNPDMDLSAARSGVKFFDFTSYTGAKFLEELDRELFLWPEEDRPACVFINPMNAYFGGSLKEGADCSAFFKGGYLGGHDTIGLEAVAKRYNVLVVIFGHTPKPPMPKELADWINDPNIAYKMCGASEIADAVRSILVFLPVPGGDNVFVFNAGKNGYSLGWTDESGAPTTKAYFRWATSGRHFWEPVAPDELPDPDEKEAAKRERSAAELDEAVSAVLAHMAYPGINVNVVQEKHGEWGLKRRIAEKAFYNIYHNRTKYGVVSRVEPPPSGHGKARTFYYVADATDAAPAANTNADAQTPAQTGLGAGVDFTEDLIF